MLVTFDFSQARFKHLNWKFRIRSFLDGKETLSTDQAVSHLHCDLGRWFYETGKAKYGHLPVVQQFEISHIALHDKIRQIIEAQQAGEKDLSERLYKEMYDISDELIALLDEAERVINSK